jgi:hypothetical protein
MSYDPSQVAFVDCETTGLDPEWDHVWEIAVIVGHTEYVWQQRANSYNGATKLPLSVDPWVLENTGISDRYDHQAAVPWRESIGRFNDLTRGRHLVGACPWFDSERLHRVHLDNSRTDDKGFWRTSSREERQHPWHYHLIDVEALAVGFLRAIEFMGMTPMYADDGRMVGTTRPIREVGASYWLWPGSVDAEMPLPWSSSDLSKAVGVDPDHFLPKHSALTDARWAKAVFEAIIGGPT